VEFTAATAIHAHLIDHPQSVCCIDEMGTFLARVNSKRAAGFQRGVSKVLRSQWVTNYGSMSTPVYAGKPNALI
jgi:hypothetical protein